MLSESMGDQERSMSCLPKGIHRAKVKMVQLCSTTVRSPKGPSELASMLRPSMLWQEGNSRWALASPLECARKRKVKNIGKIHRPAF